MFNFIGFHFIFLVHLLHFIGGFFSGQQPGDRIVAMVLLACVSALARRWCILLVDIARHILCCMLVTSQVSSERPAPFVLHTNKKCLSLIFTNKTFWRQFVLWETRHWLFSSVDYSLNLAFTQQKNHCITLWPWKAILHSNIFSSYFTNRLWSKENIWR